MNRLRRLALAIVADLRISLLAIWRGVVGFYHSDNLTFASSIAYYALLSLFPFFLLLFSILGSVTTDPADRATILEFILRYFPRQFEFVTTQMDSLQQSRIQLGFAGSFLMVWASMGVFGAITTAVNHAWGVDKQPSYLKHNLTSFVMLVAASLLLLIAFLMFSAINVVEARWFAGVVARAPQLAVLHHFAIRWGTTAVFIVVVGLIFYFVPNAKVRFRDVWVGAVVTGLAWRGALFAFSWYVKDLTRFSNIHGSIAAVVVFLVWIYISAVLLLYGVEVTAANARLRRHRPDEVPAAPSPRV